MKLEPNKTWLLSGIIAACFAVIIGAFGAHGLEGYIEEVFEDAGKRMANWETGARYQMYHAFALIALGLTGPNSKLAKISGILFIVGILLFSGCLYGWVVFDIKPLVMIVPLGGLAFIVGWIVFAIDVLWNNGNEKTQP